MRSYTRVSREEPPLLQPMDVVRTYRTDCLSRLRDVTADFLAVVQWSRSHTLSDPTVASLIIIWSRLVFLYDLASNALVARALGERGDALSCSLICSLMVLPYAVLVVALRGVVSEKLSRQAGRCGGWRRLLRTAASALWLLGGFPACVAVDLYLSLRYFGCEPRSSVEFHYMTLRGVAELVGAVPQLLFQSYVGWQHWAPRRLGGGSAEGVGNLNPCLLASSIATSAYVSVATHYKLRMLASYHCAGSVGRFLGLLCQLGGGLAPSDFFEHQLRRVVVPCDLQTVSLREMRRLSSAAKRALQLEELIFWDASWIAILAATSGSRQAVQGVLSQFASSPTLRHFELLGAEVPEWAYRELQRVAAGHPRLELVEVEGRGAIRGSFVERLPGLHLLLRAVDQADVASVQEALEAPPPQRGGDGAEPLGDAVLTDALSLAALSGSLSLLRAVLLGCGPQSSWEVVLSRESPFGELLYGQGRGASPLHFAVFADDWRAVHLLVAARAVVNVANQSGMTALHCSALYGRDRALLALLEAAAEVDKVQAAEDSPMSTPLHCAAEADSAGCVQLLLARHADPDRPDEDGATPVHLATQSDSVRSLQLLLRARGHVDLPERRSGATPLTLAARRSCVQSAGILVAARADLTSAAARGLSPLLVAAVENNLEVMRLLLQAQADVNQAALLPGEDGLKPSAEELTTTHRPESLYAAGEGSFALLAAAARPEGLESASLLVAARADVDKARDGDGCTPLCAAAGEDQLDVLQLLLAARADVNKAMRDGSTPVSLAAVRGSHASLQVLLAARADANLTQDNGASPLLLAAQGENMESLHLLVAAMADLNQAMGDGETPTSVAARQNSCESLQFLLAAQADANQATNDGSTPLFMAAESNSWESLELLLRARADMNRARVDGGTPVLLAAQNNKGECLQLLLAAQAHPTEKRNDGVTPLVMAAVNGHCACIEMLLHSKVDPQSEWQGLTALGWAQRHGHPAAAAALLHAGARP